MADPIESFIHALSSVFSTGGAKAIVSEAPGVGPESEREGHRAVIEATHNGRLPLGWLAEHPSKGRAATGYGGHGDPAILDTQVDAEIAQEIAESLRRSRHTRLREPALQARIRLQKTFSLDAHVEWPPTQAIAGATSFFENSTVAPIAGTSIQIAPILLPPGTVSPAFLLDRYPGAMYMSIFVKSFSVMPLGTAMTGLQSIYYIDPGGAVVGLGIYNPANTSADQYQNITTLCATPITDPGTAQLGTLVFHNINIGGTPVGSQYQLNLSYIAFFAPPWFNEQAIVPPTPAQVTEGLLTVEAQ